MFGHGAFETLRTYQNKKIFRAEDHLDRLLKSVKEMDLRMKFSRKEIIKMLSKTVKKNPNKLQRIKLIALKEGVIVISEKLKNEEDVIKRGVKCKSVECNRFMPQVKSLSYLDSFLSHQKAKKEGFYEAILVNSKKEVFEGAYSNIFWFENQTLCTRKSKILAGISRKTVLEISPFKPKHKNIKIQELKRKTEVFMTQTSKGIVPIIQIDKSLISKGKPGPKTRKLISLFKKFTKAYSESTSEEDI